ncbi:hypothetical protein LIER_36206 [Lithospermum erythrorhizon]|uniref:FRIGIDA-like protein n=1 Tax=Lithospermum erythrorhizon TaxID=34254 RepID=A0AAV3P734_LITER
MRRTITFKSRLNLELNKKCKELDLKLKEKAQRVEELILELANKKEMAKAWSIEKAQLQAERDSLQIEKEVLQNRNGKLERDKLEEAAKASESHFTNNTLLSFISCPAYEKKVGSECAAYLYSLVASTQGRFPDLVTLFNEEVARRHDLYLRVLFCLKRVAKLRIPP